MPKIRVLEAAADEAVEAAARYELQQPGLGIDFEHAVDAALDLLEEEFVPLVSMPGTAGTHGAKRIILKRFPYDVVVKERDGEFLVIAIAHHSRRPGYWRDRKST